MRIEDAQIRQPTVRSPVALADWIDTRDWLRADQQRDINRQALWTRAGRDDGPFDSKLPCRLLRGQRRTNCRP